MKENEQLWKAHFVFRGKTKFLHIDGSQSEADVKKHFQKIAKKKHWKLIRVFRGNL